MSIDKRLRLIGFHKMYENSTGCRYFTASCLERVQDSEL